LADAVVVEKGAGCLESERLIAHVRMWLDRDRVALDIHVRVYAEAKANVLAFDITRGGTTGTRVFDPSPKSCDDAHAVIGLAIALAIDAERLTELLAAPEPARMRLAQLQVSATYAVLPDGALGGQLGTEIGLVSWLSARLDVNAQYAWDETILGSRGRFDAWLLAGSLQACTGGFAHPLLRLALCVGPQLGALHASGKGYAPNASATAAWFGIRSGLRFDAHLGLHWMLDLDVISSIYSPAFHSEQRAGADLERKPSATGFMLSLGPALSF
jgi:hypothetical protein